MKVNFFVLLTFSSQLSNSYGSWVSSFCISRLAYRRGERSHTRRNTVHFYTSIVEASVTLNPNSSKLKVGLSPSKKKLFYLLQWKSFKSDKKCFLFHPKSFYAFFIILKIFKFLSWLFHHIEKTAWLEIYD